MDVNNIYDLGANAIISWGGPDRTKSQLIANSIIEFLENHFNRLQSEFFFNKKGYVEWFPNDPR